MQNVAPTRRLNRRSRDFLIAAALVFLSGAALAVAGISLHVFSLVVPFNRGYEVYDLTRKALLSVGMGITFVAMLMALRSVTWKTDNAAARQLGEQLAEQLDHQFVFIRSVSRRTIGYIDGVLVSKHGVLVLRVTRRKGQFFNEGGQWLRRRRNGNWRPMRWNPTREVVTDAKRVKQYLSDYRLPEVPVYAAVVFIREAADVQLKLQRPDVPVVDAGDFIDKLQDSYFAANRLDAATVQEVVNLLYQ